MVADVMAERNARDIPSEFLVDLFLRFGVDCVCTAAALIVIEQNFCICVYCEVLCAVMLYVCCKFKTNKKKSNEMSTWHA